MKDWIKVVSEIERIAEEYMRPWDGKDITTIPKEIRGYREIFAKAVMAVETLCPTSAVEVEPLAVLADRKGYGVHAYRYDQMGDIYISLSKGHRNNWVKRWNAPTYAECEAKVRAYLKGLPDQKGETK